jgi:hypothetical protein
LLLLELPVIDEPEELRSLLRVETLDDEDFELLLRELFADGSELFDVRVDDALLLLRVPELLI